jgi:hypothetical protein
MLTIGLVFCIGHQAYAGIIGTYSDRASFESNVFTFVTEDFESFGGDTTFNGTSLDVGDFSLLALGNTLEPPRRNKVDVPSLEFGLFNLNGTAIANVSLDAGGSMLMTFEHPIMAFGADFAHMNNRSIRTEIIVDGETLAAAVAPATEPRFFGFMSDTPFTVVQFHGVIGSIGDGFGIDNVSYSEACAVQLATVPEPSSLLSFATLMVVSGGFSRRRRQASRH